MLLLNVAGTKYETHINHPTLSDPGFCKALRFWLAYKIERREALSQLRFEVFTRNMLKLGRDNAIEAIYTSIEFGVKNVAQGLRGDYRKDADIRPINRTDSRAMRRDGGTASEKPKETQIDFLRGTARSVINEFEARRRELARQKQLCQRKA